jgi:threonyl-tRNA synthetase
MRLADFGVLHRNELSGSLGGLTRVRRFQQDDAHIFCLAEQVSKEVVDFLQFLKYTYDIFGFKYELDLSTRPEKYLGEIEQWDIAEDMLTKALIEFTGKKCGEAGGWDLNPGDGAFYGPKIDIKVFDALKRRHQCATLQLDFQLPIRFNLQVQSKHAQQPAIGDAEKGRRNHHADGPSTEIGKSMSPAPLTEHPSMDAESVNGPTTERTEERTVAQEDGEAASRKLRQGFERPVIIHRALYGSFERFFAILIEHYGGYWPFWLSPRQAIVVPISEKFMDYALEVQSELRKDEFYVDIDSSDRTIGKKMAEARNNYYNTILVVGEHEVAKKTVNMRERGVEETASLSVPEVAAKFAEWRAAFK